MATELASIASIIQPALDEKVDDFDTICKILQEQDDFLTQFYLDTKDLNDCNNYTDSVKLFKILQEEFKKPTKEGIKQKSIINCINERRAAFEQKYSGPEPEFNLLEDKIKHDLTKVAEQVLINHPYLTIPDLYVFDNIIGPAYLSVISPNAKDNDEIVDNAVNGLISMDMTSRHLNMVSGEGFTKVSYSIEVPDKNNIRGGSRVFFFVSDYIKELSYDSSKPRLVMKEIAEKSSKIFKQKNLNYLVNNETFK